MADFDIIVAGGGSAGCVLAAELSADPGLKVLLIEAGRRDINPWIHIPATFFKVMRGGRDAIVYEGEAEEGLNNRPFLVPQGYVLGGGSSVNAMLYVRGQAQDYDDWAAAGATGWAWHDVLPVFKRLEGNRDFGEPYHGQDGPLIVSNPRHRHPLAEAFLDACNGAQIRSNPDFNGARQEGVGFYQTTISEGRRCSSAKAFLKPALKRPNLTVMTETRVDRVLIENGRAVGVRLVDGRQITAARAVVLTAGALASPLILMRSGIGARKKLDALGIPLVADLPGVGQNYQDHMAIPVEAETAEPISVYGEDRLFRGAGHMLRYLYERRGLLSSNMIEAGGFVDVSGGGRPDIQFHMMPGFSGAPGVAPIEGHGISFSVCVLRPKSRGSVELRSSDPETKGLFRGGVLTDPGDVELSLKGLRLALSLLDQPALSRVLGRRRLPEEGPDTEDSLIAHIRDSAKTVYHPVGTAKIGDAADDMSVVDPHLRVRGIDGLRVADASVMPNLISGNTNAPSIMIGARAAEFIKGAS
ncbi:GMC family oxidoreductase [Paracoccus albus]|uniref:GMC family oxidoreductase n=1 Tax=Paracoccus albus TaxID=3017784 RepID=UPI0022F03576|nr:GMC family oxidoreductase N-terminal domain-containing protein [Paracoccus albus]WBU59278.1 GMC family oxidoreductase N-terminal domain-containing protein [Paracoccus albus]